MNGIDCLWQVLVIGFAVYLSYAIIGTHSKMGKVEEELREIKELIKKQERAKFKHIDVPVDRLADSGNEERQQIPKLWEGFPLHLYVQGNETLIGVLNEDEVLSLEKHIEIENYESPKFSVTPALIEYLKEKKADPKLLKILVTALGKQGEVSVYLM